MYTWIFIQIPYLQINTANMYLIDLMKAFVFASNSSMEYIYMRIYPVFRMIIIFLAFFIIF